MNKYGNNQHTGFIGSIKHDEMTSQIDDWRMDVDLLKRKLEITKDPDQRRALISEIQYLESRQLLLRFSPRYSRFL